MGRWIAYAVVLLLLAVALVLGTQGGKHRRLAETPRVQAVPAPQEPPAAFRSGIDIGIMGGRLDNIHPFAQ